MVLLEELEDDKLRELWQDAISDFTRTGDVAKLLSASKWRRPVVPIDEFIFGDTYLRQNTNEVFPGVLDALHQLDTDQFDEAILKGALGIGKTTLANLATARDLYKLSCMANPHQVYGISTGSPIVFTMQSVRLSTAKKVVFGEFGRYVRNSPYFKTKFPYDKNITSEMIFPEHNISLMPVSSSGSAVISMNVIGGQLDEANFMEKSARSKSSLADNEGNFDQAKHLYNTLASRRKSRFIHREGLPGTLFIISSSRFPDDFTENKAKEAAMMGGEDDRIFVFGGSQWEIKGLDKFSNEFFTVQIGNETYPSRVIERDPKTGEDTQAVAPGCDSIRVPMDLYLDFKRDVEGQIRDAAGMTTQSTHPFITQRHKIAEANQLAQQHGYENPCPVERVNLKAGIPGVVREVLRTDIDQPRHAHIDLGIRRDAAGLAIGHIAGWRLSIVGGTPEILPVVAYDIILQIVPPDGGEIELEDIRTFLVDLRNVYGLPLESISFDQFQSVDSRQILRKKGFAAGYASVEGVEEYRTYRDALYSGRILQYAHGVANRELAQVETVKPKTGTKEKVDHRPNGSKDVADGLVGVAAYLLNRKINWLPSIPIGTEPGLYLIGKKENAGKPSTGNVITSPHDIENQLKRRKSLRKKTNRRPSVRR